MVIFGEGKSLQNTGAVAGANSALPSGWRAQRVYTRNLPNVPLSPSYCARVIAALISQQVSIYGRMASLRLRYDTRNFLTSANTTAISYRQRVGQGY